MYKKGLNGTITRISDGAHVPPDPRNSDYTAYKEWVDEGNTPEDADPPPLVFKENTTLLDGVTTTNASPTEISTFRLQNHTGYFAELTLIAVDLGNGNMKTVTAHICAKRLGGGALIVGSPSIISTLQNGGASSWGVAAAASGNNIVITVTGEASRTINWTLFGSTKSFTPGGR